MTIVLSKKTIIPSLKSPKYFKQVYNQLSKFEFPDLEVQYIEPKIKSLISNTSAISCMRPVNTQNVTSVNKEFYLNLKAEAVYNFLLLKIILSFWQYYISLQPLYCTLYSARGSIVESFLVLHIKVKLI